MYQSKTNLIFILGALIGLLIFNSIVYGGTPHGAQGLLRYSDSSIPSSVTFTAYIKSRSGEILNQGSTGCGYYGVTGAWWVECGNFPTSWSPGDVLHVDFNDGAGGTGSDEITLTVNNPDNGGTTTLIRPNRQITIQTNPAGLLMVIDGTSRVSPYVATWEQGSSHTLSVISPQNESGGERDVYYSWSDGGAQTHSYTVPGYNGFVTANFDKQYLLTIISDYGNPPDPTWYDKFALVTFSVTTPHVDGMTRYIFDHWSGDHVGTNPVVFNFNMNSPKTVTAHWNTQYYLEIKSRHGYVSGEGWKDVGESINFYMTATMVSGGTGIRYVFTDWTGSGDGHYDGTNTSPTITMNNPIIQRANWTTQYFLTTSTDPASGGEVVIGDADGWCDSSATISVTADSNYGFGFVWWEEDLNGNDNPTSIVMSTPKHVKAKFGNRVEITVDANIAGRSFIVDGTPYSSTQVFTWTQFLTHTLSINSPQPGGTGERFVFTSWSHGQTQNHTYTVPGSDQTLTANFKRQYYLTLNSPHGSLQGGNVYCDENTWINFSVTTPDQQGNTRYVFLEWTGHYTGDEPSGWIYMDSPKTVTAVWNTQHYLHVVSFHGNPTGDGWYNAGEPAPFGITTPASGETGIQYIFLEWSGTGSGSYSGTNTNPTVNMNNPIKETADWKTQFFLTTSENPAEYGNITPLPPGVWRDSSDVQSISAAPETGYHFARWDGDLAGTQNPIDLTIDAPKSVTAFFGEQVQITVKTSPTRLAFYVDGVYYNYTKNFNDWIENSYHILYTHYEQPGSSGIRYLFLRWSNYLPQSHTYTVPGYNQVVTAYFKTQYRLQVNSEHGNPTPSEPTWHDGGTEAYFSVNSSEEYGDTRYNFWKWSGDYTGMDTSGHVTMTSPKSVTALWNYQYKLTINSPYGEVHIENDGWYNENDTAYFYITSQEVDDSTRHVFIEWIGDYTGTDTSGAIVMDSPKTITTNWRKEYYLYIHENPDEGGDVLPGPPGQWCDNGSQIQVVAAPNRAEDYIFGGWTGDEVSIDSSIIITMDRSKGVTANFLLLGKIRITTNPVGLQIVVDDSLKISPADFTWPSDSRHTIGAISPQSEINGSRYVFDSWNDTGPISHEITVNGISIYTASFIKQYHLSSQSDPTEGGTVIHSPPGSWLDDESVVTLEAVPDSIAGFIFWKWGGDLTGKNNPESVVMDTSKQIIASFISGTCSLEVLIQPLGSGTVTSNPVKELFKRGEFVELTAIPEEGYSFKDWTGDTISTNNPITIQLNTNKYLIANFIDETEGFPLLVDCCPPHGAKEIPKNAHIQFSVVDQNNSSGIDRSSIDVSVDNVDIILNGMIQEGCQVELMGRRSGYTIRYQPNENFIEDSQIVVHVRCQDLSLYQNEVDSTYTFSIGQSPVIVTKEQMIDQAGGTIIDDLTGIEIEIPAGAVEDTTYITIGYYQNPPPLPDSVRYVDMAYHFGPEGFQFADSALLRITYYPSDLANAGVTNPYDLPVYYYSTSSGHWIRLNILYASSYYVEVKVKEFCYLLFGEKEITSIEGNQDNLPRAYALKQNYPNPFNASTTIDYAVPEQSHIRLAVYNVRGECIYELITGQCDPGTYQVHFDASELGSGLYFYRMDAKSNSSNEIYGYVRKMIILK